MVPGMVLCFLAFGEDSFVSEGLVSLFDFSRLAIVAINRTAFSAAPCCPILVMEMFGEMEVGTELMVHGFFPCRAGDEARRVIFHGCNSHHPMCSEFKLWSTGSAPSCTP